MSEKGVERKLTTILAADVVGYSRLMGEDEAEDCECGHRVHSALADPVAMATAMQPHMTTVAG